MGASKTLLAACMFVMIAIIVSVDVLLFKNHFWMRLMANVGIVLAFAALFICAVPKIVAGLARVTGLISLLQ